jgi:hypothetical protein
MRNRDSKALAVAKIAQNLAQRAFGGAVSCCQRFPTTTFLLTQIFLR